MTFDMQSNARRMIVVTCKGRTTNLVYLISFVVVHVITHVVEVYRLLRKVRLDNGNGVHRDVEMRVACRSGKDKLRHIFSAGEVVQRKAERRELRQILVQGQLGHGQCATEDDTVTWITKLIYQRAMLC